MLLFVLVERAAEHPAQVPGVTSAMEVAFMDGLSRGSLVIGLMCLAGSAFAWSVLPGNRYDPLAEGELAAPITQVETVAS